MSDVINSLPVRIMYCGQTRRDDWQCDQWRIEISTNAGFWSTDYFTGLGLRHKIRKTPVKPSVLSIMESLFLDASAADLNFSDWCAEYGYSDDSISAFNTYKKCLGTAVALRKHFSPDVREAIRSEIEEANHA